jgi:A/G-specific adenine glycosylase
LTLFLQKFFSLIIDLMEFKRILAQWYVENRRELPWRNSSNPYHIWISEIILQQTRVIQGISYYHRFIETFPTIFDLANAPEDLVLKVWQGLGYYTRARNLHNAAKLVVKEYGGTIPDSYDELIKIRGIGPYSAGAIASFAFKKPIPAIDGNVYRIIARIFGVFTLPTTGLGKREFNQIVSDLMDRESPDTFNQALLDFGALQCIPRGPKCQICPFISYCYAFQNNMVESLPSKGKKTIPRDRYFNYLLVNYKGQTFISKRKSNDIWHSLYEFPLIETNNLIDPEQLPRTEEWKTLLGSMDVTIKYISPLVKHQLSHQTLHTRFVVVEVDSEPLCLMKNFLMIPTERIDDYSTPRLIDNFLAAEPAATYFINPSK